MAREWTERHIRELILRYGTVSEEGSGDFKDVYLIPDYFRRSTRAMFQPLYIPFTVPFGPFGLVFARYSSPIYSASDTDGNMIYPFSGIYNYANRWNNGEPTQNMSRVFQNYSDYSFWDGDMVHDGASVLDTIINTPMTERKAKWDEITAGSEPMGIVHNGGNARPAFDSSLGVMKTNFYPLNGTYESAYRDMSTASCFQYLDTDMKPDSTEWAGLMLMYINRN